MNSTHKILGGSAMAILAGSILLECNIQAPGIALIAMGIATAMLAPVMIDL